MGRLTGFDAESAGEPGRVLRKAVSGQVLQVRGGLAFFSEHGLEDDLGAW
jgi:hypothetical protein